MRATAHAPLDNAFLSFDGLLPPWHHAHTAGAVLLVGRRQRMRPVLASPLFEVPRKTPRLTVRSPIISIPLPEGPGIAISVDCFGPLPVTPRGNRYILLVADRFSRRADTFAVAAAQFIEDNYLATSTTEYQIVHCNLSIALSLTCHT